MLMELPCCFCALFWAKNENNRLLTIHIYRSSLKELTFLKARSLEISFYQVNINGYGIWYIQYLKAIKFFGFGKIENKMLKCI